MLTDMLSPRLDFILFVDGLGLFFVACFAWYLFRGRRELSWLWLGLFAASSALSTALFLIYRASLEGAVLRDVSWSLSALGYFFLALFGLHCLSPGRMRGLGYVLAGVLLVWPAAAAVVWGVTGFRLAVQLGLGPVSGLVALSGMLRFRRMRTEAGLIPSFTPLLMIYTALATLLPAGQLLLRLGGGSAPLEAALPGAVPGALMAAAVAALATAMARSPAFGGGESRGLHAYAIGLTAVGFAVFVGFTVTETLGHHAEDTLKTELSMRVNAVGHAIEPALVAQLKGREDDLRSPSYRRLLRQLTKIRLANPDLRFVYLAGLRMPDRAIIITLDTEPPTSEDYAPPGEVYAEAPEELQAIFNNGKSALVGPYQDRWGVWVSGFAPIKDEYGAILGVVGMDVRAKAFRSMVATNRLIGIVMTFLLAVIGAGLGLIIQRKNDLADANELLQNEMAERQAAQRDLAESEQQYRNVVERANDGIALIKDMRLQYANPGLAEMLETTVTDLQGRPVEEIAAEDQRAFLLDMCRRRLKGEDSPGGSETTLLTARGRSVPVELSAGITPYEGQPAVLVLARDVTDRKRAEEQLRDSEQRYRELSITDDLTGLFNSRFFYDQLDNELQRANRYGQQLALILMDMDDFKRINDVYGHLEGDRVLASLGEILTEMTRVTDSAYRYGGEEFALLLPSTAGDEAMLLAERIRARVAAQTFQVVDGETIAITVSIGVAELHEGEGARAFVQRADAAMYLAKETGKNRTHAAD